jgi:hypothetical protein
MVSATCTVNKGDLPIHVWWVLSNEYDRNERNLTTNDGIVITRNNQRISMLSIEAVKARHRGNYTCFAKNNGGLVQQSAYLAINGDLLDFLNARLNNFVLLNPESFLTIPFP